MHFILVRRYGGGTRLNGEQIYVARETRRMRAGNGLELRRVSGIHGNAVAFIVAIVIVVVVIIVVVIHVFVLDKRTWINRRQVLVLELVITLADVGGNLVDVFLSIDRTAKEQVSLLIFRRKILVLGS